MAAPDQFQHPATDIGQAGAAPAAFLFGGGQGLGDATVVIMMGLRKIHRACHG
jgi:hypothetical protein